METNKRTLQVVTCLLKPLWWLMKVFAHSGRHWLTLAVLVGLDPSDSDVNSIAFLTICTAMMTSFSAAHYVKLYAVRNFCTVTVTGPLVPNSCKVSMLIESSKNMMLVCSLRCIIRHGQDTWIRLDLVRCPCLFAAIKCHRHDKTQLE